LRVTGMFCKKCGNELKKDSNFCSKCGSPVILPAAQESSDPTDPVLLTTRYQTTIFSQPVYATKPAAEYQNYVSNAAFTTAAVTGVVYPAVPIKRRGQGEFVLRPLDIGQLFDVAVIIFIRYFKYIFGVAAIAALPLLLTMLAGGTLSFMSDLNGAQALLFIPMFMGFILFFLMIVMQQGAMVKLISDIYMNNEFSIGGSYRAAFSKTGALIVASILYAILTRAGLVFCLVPGIYVMIAAKLYPQLMMLENKGIIESLERSWKLVQGSWFRFALALFLGSIFMVVFFMLSLTLIGFITALRPHNPALAAMQPFLGIIPSAAFLLGSPFITVISVLFYYDLRVRKEAFDLVVLAREIA
jgi:hypothetical protein